MTRRIELSPRLRLAADLVPEGAPGVADVGTDHAYLPACLLMEGKIPSAIAADLREGPLSRARETAAEYGCGDRMAFRLCDGLSGIRPEETDAVVIAGMGGETIAPDPWRRPPWVRTRKIPLVLQPMSSIPELRQRLGEDGFHILEERLAREGGHPLCGDAGGGGGGARHDARPAVGRPAEPGPPAGGLSPWTPGEAGPGAGRPFPGERRAGGGPPAGIGGPPAGAVGDARGVGSMAAVTEIFEAMDRWAPFETQMDFDNAGFLVAGAAGRSEKSWWRWTSQRRWRRRRSAGALS